MIILTGIAAGAGGYCVSAIIQERELARTNTGLAETKEQFQVVREGAEKLLERQKALEADVAELTTPLQTEALKMWAGFPEVCKRQTLGNLVRGDYGCAVEALPSLTKGEAFPSGGLRAEILKDPAKALAMGDVFLKDRCRHISGARPQVCHDYGHGYD